MYALVAPVLVITSGWSDFFMPWRHACLRASRLTPAMGWAPVLRSGIMKSGCPIQPMKVSMGQFFAFRLRRWIP